MLLNEMDFVSQIKSLLDPEVEYIGIINKNGRLEEKIYKNDINLSEEKKEMFCMGIRLQNSMESDFDDDLGPVNYTIAERGRSKFVSIPIFSHTVLAVMSKNTNHTRVINKIKVMLRDFKNSKIPRVGNEMN